MIKHPIFLIALHVFLVSALFLVGAICLNLVVYSYIDYTFPGDTFAAAK